MATQAANAQKALDAKDYPTSIAQFTQALATSNSPLWLIGRSTAYQRSSQPELALKDAEAALHAAISRGKRELIATAQFRRAVACYSLGRLGDARMCLIWCRAKNEKEKGLGIWQQKVAKEYEALPEDSEGRNISVKEIPDEVKEAPVEVKKEVKEKAVPKEKIREEWFQSSAKISITIFAKGVPKDKAEVEIEKRALTVRFPTALGSTYDYSLAPLFADIDPSQSSFSVTPNKVEINLHKVTPGQKWSALESSNPADLNSAPSVTPSAPSVTPTPAASTGEKLPSYPTSSRSGPKDWDKVVETDLEGVKEEGDDINNFFKTLYKDADPDTRRAMMKSFQESNGTALSTDWKDVSSRKMETTPPDGVDMHDW